MEVFSNLKKIRFAHPTRNIKNSLCSQKKKPKILHRIQNSKYWIYIYKSQNWDTNPKPFYKKTNSK